MRRQSPLAVLVIILVGLHQSVTATVRPRVIYGGEDRQDYFEIASPAWRERADATVALIRPTNLVEEAGTTQIRTSPYGAAMGLCASEPFFAQETAAFCSGSLVSPDTIITAGHCVRTQASCENTRFVFGFRLQHAGEQPRTVQTDQVFSCERLVHSVVNSAGEDFAVVKLDRPVNFARPLPIRQAGQPSVGEALVVMGHPVGLPLKLAGGASVRSVRAQHLIANLDTYGGNSGSAVMNEHTGEIEGILVRGELDFVYQNGCRVSNRCADSGCRGEDVTLIERVRPHL